MTLRVATIVLAISAMLLCTPEGASAQGRGREFGGFQHGRPGLGGGFGRGSYRPEAGRPRFAPPPFAGRGFDQAPRAFSRFGYGQPPEVRRFGGYAGPPVYGAPAYPPAYPGQPYAAPFRFGGNWREQQNEVRQAVREGRHIPLGQAIDAVRRRSPGRELDADIVPGADGRADYRLRWAASDGRRIDYLVDAATGAIVGVEGGR